MKLSLIPSLFLISTAAATAHDVECQGSCDVNLGLSCDHALETYEFSGNCCSLQEVHGECHLMIATGWCDYGTKGYDRCMDRKEESGEGGEEECGTIYMLMAMGVTTKDECLESQFAIPDPMMQMDDDEGIDTRNIVTVEAELVFSFLEGKARRQSPTDLEIQGVMKQTKAFFNESLILSSDFQLEYVRSNYDYATGEVALAFALDFVGRDDVALDEQQRMAEDILSSVNYNGEYLIQYVWKAESPREGNVFHSTHEVKFQ